jgi:hypothetical protein
MGEQAQTTEQGRKWRITNMDGEKEENEDLNY